MRCDIPTRSKVLNLALAFVASHAAVGEGQLHVFIHREVADQVERLKNETDFAITDARPLGQLEPLHRTIVQNVSSIRRRIEQAQNRQQRGLPAARGAGDRYILALLNVHLDSRQRVGLHFIGYEYLGDAL